MVLSTKYSLNLMLVVVVDRNSSDYGGNSNVHIELISCWLGTRLSLFSHGNFHRRHPMTKVFFSFLNVSSSLDKKIPPVDDEISITEFEVFFSLLLLSPSGMYARDREKCNRTTEELHLLPRKVCRSSTMMKTTILLSERFLSRLSFLRLSLEKKTKTKRR